MKKFNGGVRVFSFLFLLVSVSAVQCHELRSNNINTVEQFIAAFNAQDTIAMAKLVADDIEWLSIARDRVIVETRGKIDLIESMNAYFKSCPTCRSKLSSVASTNDRVSAIEIASWQGKDGAKSQRAISVYEFSEGMITRVYYFPAEK